MIPQRYILEWKQIVPWVSEAQVEQDLVISRALIEMFSSPPINESLAFRGGMALHKLYVEPQARYSEDIDLVQISSAPIHSILKEIRKCLDFLGTKRIVKQHIHNNTIIYRFESEFPPIIDLRLKIEINTREHFSVLGFKQIPFEMKNLWFTGSCKLTSYCLEELLGTKLRALYQRRKGRDLFDLYWAMIHNEIDIEKVFMCYHKYMDFVVEQPPTRKQFLQNMTAKLKDNEFITDMYAIIRPELSYNIEEAWETVKNNLIENI